MPTGKRGAGRVGERWALVLAGGDGTRLRELTRAITGAPIPKQYCRILGDRSLLETTLERVAGFAPPERTLVVVSRPHLRLAEDQLSALPLTSVLVQPCNRDTGPGVLFGLLEIARRDPAARVAVFPSDHYVGDEGVFLGHIARALEVVERYPKRVALLGIRPECTELGYGYIEPTGSIELPGTARAFHVKAFHEKPPAELAARIVRDGGLWNSFLMVFHVTRMLALLKRARTTEFEEMRALGQGSTVADGAYQSLTRWNFSSDFLTSVPQHLVVIAVADVHWSDWGTPQAIEQTLVALGRRVPFASVLPSGVVEDALGEGNAA